jgi:hypothetical protein
VGGCGCKSWSGSEVPENQDVDIGGLETRSQLSLSREHASALLSPSVLFVSSAWASSKTLSTKNKQINKIVGK